MKNEVKDDGIGNEESVKRLDKLEKTMDFIPESLKLILDKLEISEDEKVKIISLFVGHRESFRGPIPSPKILKGYNEAFKDGAERVVVMAEKQLEHRIQLEDYSIKEELSQSRIGQIFGFILGLIGLTSATVLALFGHETTAGIFGTTTIVGLVAVFVIGRKSLQRNS